MSAITCLAAAGTLADAFAVPLSAQMSGAVLREDFKTPGGMLIRIPDGWSNGSHLHRPWTKDAVESGDGTIPPLGGACQFPEFVLCSRP